MNKRFSSLAFLSVLIAAGYTFPVDAQILEERLAESALKFKCP